MSYAPLSRFLLRAPLLPVAATRDAARALLAHPLGRDAIQLASPRLAASADGVAAQRALGRYGRRAAFRPTPHGLLAGVTMGTLGAATKVATGTARARLELSWGRAARLGRALLDDPRFRAQANLRATPSLLRGADAISWLAMGDLGAEQREAQLDETLARILHAVDRWTPWPRVRLQALADQQPEEDRGDGDDELDDLLLLLIDDGLLLHDLAPPLIGPPPLAWLRQRLTSVPEATPLSQKLQAIAADLIAGDLARATSSLRGCPGAQEEDSGVQAVLTFQARGAVTLERAVVRRAAALAPLLFRLQDALSPPMAERLSNAAVGEALNAATEIFGAGALDVPALALGAYGVSTADAAPAESARHTSPPRLLTLLIDRMTAALACGLPEVAFDADQLASALDEVHPAPPPTAELFLTPCRPPRGAAAGTGWLLGLHAPAGATWGRFLGALGAPMAAAMQALVDAERSAAPGVEVVDVDFAPSAALADLCGHPLVRDRTLALTSWPSGPAKAQGGDDAVGDDAVITVAALELCADPAGAVPLTLRVRDSRTPVVPSPLSRVRSTTAPGWYQPLVGWSFTRQHAPWALALGPLADLARQPRLSVDGFVIAPASWRLPHDGGGTAPPLDRRTLTRWRRALGVPRFVQVGSGDELLPVDLDDPGAAADLAGATRVWELWPPPTRGVDRDGRRCEAVIALVDRPRGDEIAQQRAAANVEAVPPPSRTPGPAASAWRTFKLFGVEDFQDVVLSQVVTPAVQQSLAANEIDGWFFLRYVDGPGRRPHLRLRVRGVTAAGRNAFARRLEKLAAPARVAGHVVTVETTEYHPERARYGGSANLPAVHDLFQADSELVCTLLESDLPETLDPLALLVTSFDALAEGLGTSLAQRHQLARERRAAADGEPRGGDAAERRRADDVEFRSRSRLLRALLAATDEDPVVHLFAAYRRRVAAARPLLAPGTTARLLPTLLHLAAVRLGGADAEIERRAYIMWERTLEGLLHAR